MKASSKFFLFLGLVLLTVFSLSAQAAEYITPVATPDEVTLKWATQIGEGWQKSAGVPLLADDSIFIISGDELLKINPESGSVKKRVTMAAAQSYGYVAPVYENGKIYMNLSEGTVQAFDAKSLNSEWIYKDPSGGKGMTVVTFSDNVVYTGFWHSETKDANYVALDAASGELLWSKTVNGGFYWAGAYCTDNAIIFATDDGNDKIAHIYSCNKKTGEVLSRLDIENKGDIRSAIKYYNGRIYATAKGGYIISAALKKDMLSDVKYGEIGSASTSTPVIYDNRIYIGANDKTISVFDAVTLTKLFSIPVTAYPQCSPLISTHYVNNGYLYLYTTYNKTPGGITLIKIKTDAASADDCIVSELYDAKDYEQYCISDIICGDDGTLYYKNDSGYLFALSSKIKVKASLSEENFLLSPTLLDADMNSAEKYGYTDTVRNNVSALDVLVSIHEYTLGDDFSSETAEDYLIVSPEGYLSRIMGTDTNNFGFAVNGKAPHDDILTEYGYTGYSLNQAVVKNNDIVEFFIYRDDWAMDTYCSFSKNDTILDSITLNKGDMINVKLTGYPFAWYSCSEESQIESYRTPVTNAKILLDGEIIATTDEYGMFSIKLDEIGNYTLSVKETENSGLLIPKQIDINVLGCEVVTDSDNTYIISNFEQEIEALIFTAGYNSDTMTYAKILEILLPDSKFMLKIDTPHSEDFKIFIWDKNLKPLAGGAEN